MIVVDEIAEFRVNEECLHCLFANDASVAAVVLDRTLEAGRPERTEHLGQALRGNTHVAEPLLELNCVMTKEKTRWKFCSSWNRAAVQRRLVFLHPKLIDDPQPE